MWDVADCIIYITAFTIVSLLIIKDVNTQIKREIIENAIYNYCMHCMFTDKPVDWGLIYRMEKYDKPLDRLWDWGYTNILPPEDFEKIKPYIKNVYIRGV